MKGDLSTKYFHLIFFLILAQLILLFILSPIAFAETALYFYDDGGRLTRVIKGTEAIIYQYDSVGNLLSITRETVSNNHPVLESIEPDMLFIGSSTSVIIKGRNLITTTDITSTNPYLTIKILNVKDTEIFADIKVSADAVPGFVNLSVITHYGSSSIQTSIISSKLSFSPSQLYLTPYTRKNIDVRIAPTIDKAISIPISNSNPSAISAPAILTIPSSGETTFVVEALGEGIATISSGSAKTIVFVTRYSLPIGEEIVEKTKKVSVYIKPPMENSSVAAIPVSIYIKPVGDSHAFSHPVSVKSIQVISDVRIQSLPLSIFIKPGGDNFAVGHPVSVSIKSQVNMTSMFQPVSVSRTSTLEEVSIFSLPVSARIAQ